MKGKIRLDSCFLSTLHHHLDEGWKLDGITKRDPQGYYWFILKKQ